MALQIKTGKCMKKRENISKTSLQFSTVNAKKIVKKI